MEEWDRFMVPHEESERPLPTPPHPEPFYWRDREERARRCLEREGEREINNKRRERKDGIPI